MEGDAGEDHPIDGIRRACGKEGVAEDPCEHTCGEHPFDAEACEEEGHEDHEKCF